MKRKKSPMELSLRLLRGEGKRVGIVERRLPIPGKFVTVDLWGFGDIIFVDATRKITGLVQTTSASNFAARVRKVQEGTGWIDWLSVPCNRIEVHGWSLRKRGTKQRRYEVRRMEIVAP